MQAVLRLGEIGRHEPRGQQLAVQSVRPGVIRAGETCEVSLGLGADERAAMPAGIVEGVDGVLIAAHDDDGFLADLVQKIVSLAPHAIDVSGHDPFACDDFAKVRGEHIGIAVKTLLQAVARAVVRGQCPDEAQLRNRWFLNLHLCLRKAPRLTAYALLLGVVKRTQ